MRYEEEKSGEGFEEGWASWRGHRGGRRVGEKGERVSESERERVERAKYRSREDARLGDVTVHLEGHMSG
jgi:hypothetical protein